MKDIFTRLLDWYNGGTGILTSNSNPGSNSSVGGSGGGGPSLTPTHMSSALQPAGSGSTATLEDGSIGLRQWNYCIDLAKHLYEVKQCQNLESLRTCMVNKACVYFQ